MTGTREWEKHCDWCGRDWTAIEGQLDTYAEVAYGTDPDFPDQRTVSTVCPWCVRETAKEQGRE